MGIKIFISVINESCCSVFLDATKCNRFHTPRDSLIALSCGACSLVSSACKTLQAVAAPWTVMNLQLAFSVHSGTCSSVTKCLIPVKQNHEALLLRSPEHLRKNISLLTVVLLFVFFVCLLYSKARIFLRCGWRTVGSYSSNLFWWMLFIGRCSMTLHSESLASLVNSLPSMYVCCYRQDSVLVGMFCWWCCCPENVLVYFKVIWYHFIMCIRCSCAFLLTQFYVFRPFLPLLL